MTIRDAPGRAIQQIQPCRAVSGKVYDRPTHSADESRISG
jgi:hypothetical protein